jgi:hypothetical protein
VLRLVLKQQPALGERAQVDRDAILLVVAGNAGPRTKGLMSPRDPGKRAAGSGYEPSRRPGRRSARGENGRRHSTPRQGPISRLRRSTCDATHGFARFNPTSTAPPDRWRAAARSARAVSPSEIYVVSWLRARCTHRRNAMPLRMAFCWTAAGVRPSTFATSVTAARSLARRFSLRRSAVVHR